jgi:hypothetical protein
MKFQLGDRVLLPGKYGDPDETGKVIDHEFSRFDDNGTQIRTYKEDPRMQQESIHVLWDRSKEVTEFLQGTKKLRKIGP